MSSVPPVTPPPSDPAPLSPPASTPPPPPADLVRSPLSDGEWHRLHPLTPVLRGGLFLLVIAGLVFSSLRDRLIGTFLPALAPDLDPDDYEQWIDAGGDPVDWVLANNLWLIALGVVFGILVILLAWFYTSWRFHLFRITGDDVEVRSGVLFRTHRRAPLDRVQGVNLTRPMVARVLGAAKLEVVGAGADGNVKLEYLSTSNAEEVRADILRLASGRKLGNGKERAGAPISRATAVTETVSRGITGMIVGDDSASAEPESVVRIPLGRLVLSQLISMSTVGLIVATVLIIIGVSHGAYWLLFSMVPALIAFGAVQVRTITKSLRYSIAPTPDGVRITFGLLTTTTEIVPPGRIHAVEVSQSIIWRGFGWWTVKMNRLSGRSMSDATNDQFTTILPVGTLADVERVLGLVLPMVAPGDHAAIVRHGLGWSRKGTGEPDPYATTPRRAWTINPLSWRRNGFDLTEDLLLMRHGVIWRRLAIVPFARMQSLRVEQGPYDRMLRVAGLRAHTVSGPIVASISGIDLDVSLAAFEEVSRRTVAAAAGDRSHRWAGEDAGGEELSVDEFGADELGVGGDPR